MKQNGLVRGSAIGLAKCSENSFFCVLTSTSPYACMLDNSVKAGKGDQLGNLDGLVITVQIKLINNHCLLATYRAVQNKSGKVLGTAG